jgi:hypothetical protein
MKAADVKIGSRYLAKVSGTVVPVRVTGTFEYRTRTAYRDGWLAVNTVSGRAIRIKSPQRFRAEA